MKSLWFVVPVHGRTQLAGICLRQLRRTCDELANHGVRATAVIVSDSTSLQELDPASLGFGFVERENRLSCRYNDGIQLATDPKYNPSPADYVVPLGSDDWVDHRLFLDPLPPPDTIFGFQRISFVNEDASEISCVFLNYQGGSGIRIIPRELVAPLAYRPADEDLDRNCDMNILCSIRRHHGDRLKIVHCDTSPYWIVDWKTADEQLNSYKVVKSMRGGEVQADPFSVLASAYPAAALEEMEQHYGVARERVA